MRRGLRYWKFFAASLMALGLALPLSKCSQGDPPRLEYHYVLEDAVENPSCQGACRAGAIGMALIALLWPVAASAASLRSDGRRATVARLCVEPLLIAATAWWLYWQLLFRDPAIGFVASVLGLTVYFAVWCVECLSFIRMHRASNAKESVSTQVAERER